MFDRLSVPSAPPRRSSSFDGGLCYTGKLEQERHGWSHLALTRSRAHQQSRRNARNPRQRPPTTPSTRLRPVSCRAVARPWDGETSVQPRRSVAPVFRPSPQARIRRPEVRVRARSRNLPRLCKRKAERSVCTGTRCSPAARGCEVSGMHTGGASCSATCRRRRTSEPSRVRCSRAC